MEQAHREEDVVVVEDSPCPSTCGTSLTLASKRAGVCGFGRLLLAGCLGLMVSASALAQDLPPDEVQVNLNGYFDNFRVNIVYPSISMTGAISPTTSLTGRYLVDVISAASMKSQFQVDGVTSASGRGHGGEVEGPDEVRNEFNVGISQLVAGATLSANGIYSTENDYKSRTIAGSLSLPFAKKNTIFSLGATQSWDIVAPRNQTWTADKNVLSLNAGLTQVLGRRTVLQLDGSWSDNRGYLNDPYQVVSIIGDGEIQTFEARHPDQRTRRAVGVRLNQSLGRRTALNLGYRYYWDNWDIKSNTANIMLQRRVAEDVVLKAGFRGYKQSKAYFFEPTYAAPMTFMSVDSKLSRGYSGEIQLGTTITGNAKSRYPFIAMLASEKVDLNFDLNLYMRHTDAPDWHSRLKDLFAYMFSVGYRYRF